MYTKGHFSQILVTNLSKSMLYNDLLYLYNPVLGTQSALNSKGESPHPPPVCSIHLDDATAAILRPNAHHTPAYWWRGDSVMKPISVWGLLGGHDGQRPMGKFGQDAGVTPLRCAKFIPVFVKVRSSIVQLRVPTYNHNKFVLHCFFQIFCLFLLFFEGHPGIFNDHRESGPRFNVSSEGRCFLQYSVPITTLGRYLGPTQTTG